MDSMSVREYARREIAVTLCPHPRTGRIARHHLHEASMQRQFKDAVRKTDIANTRCANAPKLGS